MKFSHFFNSPIPPIRKISNTPYQGNCKNHKKHKNLQYFYAKVQNYHRVRPCQTRINNTFHRNIKRVSSHKHRFSHESSRVSLPSFLRNFIKFFSETLGKKYKRSDSKIFFKFYETSSFTQQNFPKLYLTHNASIIIKIAIL